MLTQSVAVFRIQHDFKEDISESRSVKPVIATPAPRAIAATDAGDNWETF
jgi:methyl-accepting chemotaxis protein I, serine sensor receptor